jgi:hypothetical protein
MRTVSEGLQIVCLTLIVLALVPALAHALEYPGKRRLAKDEYSAVQRIYYPGFTTAGFSEPLALACAVVLLVLTPRGDADFWLTLAALLALCAMHAVYWLVTHPVNNFWLRDEKLGAAGAGFFSIGAGATQAADWTKLRDRWEYSHVARAVLAFSSFIALLGAIA